MKTFPVKRLPDGRALLNIGCGTRMDWQWNNLDFSPYARLRRWPRAAALLDRAGVLSSTRRERLARVDPDIVAWNLVHGIPFPDGTFDALYQSHVLEHFPRSRAVPFLAECGRVLKSGGVLRVVVPDLRQLTALYDDAYARYRAAEPEGERLYDRALFELFDQMTRDDVTGTTEQARWLAPIERFLRGDSSAVGDRHRWAYDDVSLGRALVAAGLERAVVRLPAESVIAGWPAFALDVEPDGRAYKPLSLYMEAIRP